MRIAELLGASKRNEQIGSRASGAVTARGYATGASANTDRRHHPLEALSVKNAGWNVVDPPMPPRKPKRQPARKLKAVNAMRPVRGVLVSPPKPLKPVVPPSSN